MIEEYCKNAFGGTYFRDVYSNINKKNGIEIHGKNLFI